jgi:hypothetical protein
VDSVDAKVEDETPRVTICEVEAVMLEPEAGVDRATATVEVADEALDDAASVGAWKSGFGARESKTRSMHACPAIAPAPTGTQLVSEGGTK